MRSRGVALALITALVVVLLVLDRDVDAPVRAELGQPDVSPMPVADTDDVLASTWYCAAGTASDGGNANLTVVVANASDAAVEGAITWHPVGQPTVATPIDVPASGSVSLAAADAVQAEVVSAVVDVRGGGIAVEHVISGPRGASVAPCASDASATWYFANGTTERDSRQVLALFNPFPDDAIVDISFASEEGRHGPGALQGLPVAAGSTTLVNVHDHVRRRAVTSTSVVTRSGRLVVDRIQSFDGELGRRGVSLTLGAPALAESWTFPEGYWADGFAEEWHIYNPGDREAEVSIEMIPVDGTTLEPIDLAVPAKGQVTVPAATAERVAPGVFHTSSVISLNGVPVVAERLFDARSPSPRRGWTSALGAPIAAESWVLPLGEVSGNTDEWVVVHNPGASALRVSVVALAGGQRLAVSGLQELPVGPGERLSLRIGDHIERSPLPLLIEANGDVVVERDLYRVTTAGVSATMGIPLP